jgi:hypothetical protein
MNQDYLNSDSGGFFYESSAEIPGCFGAGMPAIFEPVMVYRKFLPSRPKETTLEIPARTELSREDLITLYAEAAEEDKNLAEQGLSHYAAVLDEEEEFE